MSLKQVMHTSPVAVAINFVLALAALMVCRVIFVAENASLLWGDVTGVGSLLSGSLLFDTSAVCYLLALYILLALLPLPPGRPRWWQAMLRWVYIVPMAIAVVASLADSVFYPFNCRRVTSMVFVEFSNEENLGSIVGIELVRHWYLVLAAIAIVYALWRLYRRGGGALLKGWRYYGVRVVVLAVAGLLVPTGMRGGSFFKSTRPISINEAHRFVSRPSATAIVLNTPFSLIRTMRQAPAAIPRWFTPDELETIYSPVHIPDSTATFRNKNVVILIIESFGGEFVGYGNESLDNGTYRGYTPFVDSLMRVSLSWEQTFANGAFSIDAMPAVLASLPRMGHPFVLSPFSTDRINSIASLLGEKGYDSAFFHGATNQSLGFNAFSHHAGYKRYYGLDEYIAAPTTGGRADFDGTWGIWDEEFLQYFCRSLGTMRQPFVATVFTLSSHHPFAVPKRYRDIFVDEGRFPLHKCIRYTDYALRQFFEQARRQPWYDNTIFILTADHASLKITHDVYNTELGHFRIPILFFDPSGTLPRERREGIAQQIDIMPTLLDHLGYDRTYVAFGRSLLADTVPSQRWALNWDNVLQYVHGDYVMHLSDDKVAPTALYNYRTDPLLSRNLLPDSTDLSSAMTRHARAIVQSFFTRANADALIETK